jgi:hypothetical protein
MFPSIKGAVRIMAISGTVIAGAAASTPMVANATVSAPAARSVPVSPTHSSCNPRVNRFVHYVACLTISGSSLYVASVSADFTLWRVNNIRGFWRVTATNNAFGTKQLITSNFSAGNIARYISTGTLRVGHKVPNGTWICATFFRVVNGRNVSERDDCEFVFVPSLR